jgi:hypothetical protein
MQEKEAGRKPFNDSVDIYDFEYKLKNWTSVLNECEKISQEDKEKIWSFIELLRGLRVSTGRIAKYIFHLSDRRKSRVALRERCQKGH